MSPVLEVDVPSVARKRHGTAEPRRHRGADVHLLHRWVEVREHEVPRLRAAGERPTLLRRQMLRDRHRRGQRTLADQHVAGMCPVGERVVEPRIAGEDDAPARALDGICHAFGAVRNLERGEPDTLRELQGLPRRDLTYREGKAGCEEPFTIRVREPAKQVPRAERPDDLQGLLARGRQAVLPREDEGRQIAVVIDVKVRERDVSDRWPGYSQLGEPARDAAPTIDEKLHTVGLVQIAGAAPRAAEGDGSGAECGEADTAHAGAARLSALRRAAPGTSPPIGAIS